MNGIVLTVSWNPVSLEDAGGFYKSNLVVSAIDQNQKIFQFSHQIPYTNSSTVFVGLLPSISYSLQINIININTDGEEIMGPLSEPYAIEIALTSNG